MGRYFRYKNIDSFLIFALGIIIFTYLINNVSTDIQIHVDKIKKINAGESFYSPNFLFYFVVNALSGFTNNSLFLNSVVVIVLSTATSLKYFFSKHLLFYFTDKLDCILSERKVVLLSVGLFFCFAVPDFYNIFYLKKMYLGRIVPVVWHNSTVIFLFPFALLLFFEQSKVMFYSGTMDFRKTLLIISLVVVNVLIKPSFIFVFAPITLLFVVFFNQAESIKTKLLYVAPIIIGGFMIIAQYLLIYKFNIGYSQEGESGVQLSLPFEVLSHWIPSWYIPISFVLSLFLPISAILLYKEILDFKPFVYSLAMLIFGIFISAFLKETGIRIWHGNFMWQNVISAFLLFLTTISFVASKVFKSKIISKRVYFICGVFMLHALSGILYLVKIVRTNSYM